MARRERISRGLNDIVCWFCVALVVRGSGVVLVGLGVLVLVVAMVVVVYGCVIDEKNYKRRGKGRRLNLAR